MRQGEKYRVFDRANWRRKARVPSWVRRAEAERRATSVNDRKPLEV